MLKLSESQYNFLAATTNALCEVYQSISQQKHFVEVLKIEHDNYESEVFIVHRRTLNECVCHMQEFEESDTVFRDAYLVQSSERDALALACKLSSTAFFIIESDITSALTQEEIFRFLCNHNHYFSLECAEYDMLQNSMSIHSAASEDVFVYCAYIISMYAKSKEDAKKAFDTLAIILRNVVLFNIAQSDNDTSFDSEE